MDKKSKNNLSTFEKDLKDMQLLLDDIESKELSLDEIIEKYSRIKHLECINHEILIEIFNDNSTLLIKKSSLCKRYKNSFLFKLHSQTE